MRCTKDILMKLLGKRRGSRQPADLLRSLVTLRFALDKTGTDLKAFAKRYAKAAESEGPGLVYRWARGQTAMKLGSVRRIERLAPGARALFLHPVFELLRDGPISRRRVAQLLGRYAHPQLGWWFGDEHLHGVVAGPLRSNSSALVQRGDLDGFGVILGLLREAEALDRLDDHIDHAANLYRAFPAVARIAWFQPFTRLLRFCVEAVHSRSFRSCAWWHVDWAVIDSQIRSAHHETIRHRCRRDPKSGHFIEPKDPVASVIQTMPQVVKNPLEARGWALRATTRSRKRAAYDF